MGREGALQPNTAALCTDLHAESPVCHVGRTGALIEDVMFSEEYLKFSIKYIPSFMSVYLASETAYN